MNSEPSWERSPITFADLTREYGKQSRAGLIKVAIFSSIVLAMIIILLTYYSQRDFVQDIVKYKPYRDAAMAVSTISRDAIEIRRLEILRDVTENYIRHGDVALRHLDAAIAATQSGGTTEYNRTMMALVDRQYVFYAPTLTGSNQVSLLNFNVSYLDDNGNGTSLALAKRLRTSVNVNRIARDHEYNWSQGSMQAGSQELDRAKIGQSLAMSAIFAGMPKDEMIAMLRRVRELLVDNISESKRQFEESIALIQEKEKTVSASLTKMATTEEIFYMSIFNRVLSALAMFGIVGVCLRLIVTELRHNNAVALSYFSFLYSEVGVRDGKRLGEVAAVITGLHERKGAEAVEPTPVKELVSAATDVLQQMRKP